MVIPVNYLPALLDNMNELLFLCDNRHRITFCNRRSSEVLGRKEEELIGRDIFKLLPEHCQKEMRNKTEAGSRSRRPLSCELPILNREGRTITLKVSVSYLSEGAKKAGFMVLAEDVSERKRAEEELRALTLVDELTGLYNRRGFITLAQQQLKIAKRMKREMLLLFADVDQLKLVNDTLGHQEGDRALIDTAHILKQTFREPDIIARIGGDEFAALIIEASRADSEAIAGRLKENIRAFNRKRARPYHLSLSAGIAHFDPASPSFVNELLEQADRLMYEEKRLKQVFRD